MIAIPYQPKHKMKIEQIPWIFLIFRDHLKISLAILSEFKAIAG